MNGVRQVATIALVGVMVLAGTGPGCGKGENAGEVELHATSPAAEEIIVRLDRHKVFHAGISVETVAARSVPVPLALPGKVGFNEKRIARITARVGGRVDTVNAFTNDRVRNLAVLARLFSQEFLAAQSEFIQAAERWNRTRTRGGEDPGGTRALYESSRRKLLGLGARSEDCERLETTRTPADTYDVLAPFDGTIIESKVVPGEFVLAGAELFSLADLRTVWVLADIYETDLPHVRPAMKAAVEVSPYQRSWTGAVSSVYGVVDENTRTVKARIEVDNADGTLKPGMFCTVRLQASLGARTVKIPASALLGETEKHFVFVALNDTTFEKREVRTGVETREFAEILDGVLEGETIVVRGGFFLKSELAKETFGEEH